MLFPSFDTLRPSSKRDSISSIHSQTRATHFRPLPLEQDSETPGPTTNSAGGKPIPSRHSSLRSPIIHHQSSFQSLTTLGPSRAISRNISASLTGSVKRFQRPGLPWAAQAPALRSSASESSFGTDFPIDEPSPHNPHTQPSSPTSSAPPDSCPPDLCEIAPGDSSSNWSLPNLARSPTPPPPVPSVPSHLLPRNMPASSAYHTEGESGYDSPDATPTTSFANSNANRSRRLAAFPSPDDLDEEDEEDENEDHVGALPGEAQGFGTSRSTNKVGGKMKADKMLGLDTNAKLCSLFMISGVGPTDAAKWVPADNVLGSRMQPQPDSLGFYWRPELLGTAFSGPATEAFEKAMSRGKKMKKDTWPLVMKPPAPGERGPFVPDAGPDGAEKLITQTIKYAHPKDVEVINTSLMPNTTSHYFSFSVPSHSVKASAARARLDSIQMTDNINQSTTSLDQMSTIGAKQRQDLQKQAKITYYGATLTVWTCAEPERARQLADIRSQLRRKNELDSVLRAPITEPLEERSGTAKRSRLAQPWMPYRNASMTDLDNSDNETVRSGMTESTRRTPWQAFGVDPLSLGENLGGMQGRGVKGTMESSDIGIGPLKAGEGDTFWMPYSLTLVSRHPIFDTMIDYIRISWSMYQKSAKRNLYQMCKILNHPIRRPGEVFRLNIGCKIVGKKPDGKSDGEEIEIETTFPGQMDFDQGMLKTDFQLWPLFQAVDIDGILTAVEIAMSRSGKVIFTSQYTAMLCLAVHTLRYMVELRGWTGMAIPVIHARDIGLAHDDPGPYIFGLPMECRYMLAPPADACVIDLDTNTLTCRSPPVGVVTPRVRRDKVKQKIFQALGKQYPIERSIPTELKIAFPNNRFRPFHRTFYDGQDQPHFLGERLKCPTWWNPSEVLGVFDKIMTDKQKKPSFFQRLTKAGLNRGDAPITVNEQDAKDSMRRRAAHYIETRDELDIKVAKINGKLMQLMQEGEKRKRQFQSFERQADLLAEEAARLADAYNKEHAEAERLEALAREQTKVNAKLDTQLKATENARSTAMRQLSDMQGSIQDLEREREAIMDIIEGQISQAIESHAAEVQRLADSASADPATSGSPTSQLSSLAPSGSQHLASPLSTKAGLPPVSRHFRPGTTESAMSNASRWTSKTDAISILGLARQGYAANASGGVRDKRASVGTAGERDEVAIRIAAIQAKLDLALSVAARNRAGVAAAAKRDPDNDPPACGDEAVATEQGGLGLDVHGQGQDSGNSTPTVREYTGAAASSSPPTPTTSSADCIPSARSTTPTSTRILPTSRPVSRASSITQRSIGDKIRPGSRLRIRRDRPSDGASSDASDASSTPAQIAGLHGKSLTSSSSANSEAEVLVTPSNSAFIGTKPDIAVGKVTEGEQDRRSSGGSGSSGDSEGSMIKADGEDEESKRMSTISTTTVTFGPIY